MRRMFTSLPRTRVEPKTSPIGMIDKSIEFLMQENVHEQDRLDIGIQSAFLDIFPVLSENASLDFVHYDIDPPAISADNCFKYGKTYNKQVTAVLRLILREGNQITSVREGKVNIGEILVPWNNTYIVSGNIRVIVSQMVRSPGVSFTQKERKEVVLMPKKGSWLIITEKENKHFFQWKIGGKRLPLALLLKAMGFYPWDVIRKFKIKSEKIRFEFLSDKRIMVRRYNHHTKAWMIEPGGFTSIVDSIVSKDIFTKKSVELLAQIGKTVDYDLLTKLEKFKIDTIYIVDEKQSLYNMTRDFISNTSWNTQEKAIMEIFRYFPYSNTIDNDVEKRHKAIMSFYNMFFNNKIYSLSNIGLIQAQRTMGIDNIPTEDVLTRDTLVDIVLAMDKGVETDMFSLENRRLKLPGEILKDTFLEGLQEAAHHAKVFLREENLSQDTRPSTAWNKRYILAAMNKFATGELCQVTDRFNPFSTIAHIMQFTSLGPGGLNKNPPRNAREIHATHMGRISPVDSTEDENIGLIGPLASGVSIDDYGFLVYEAFKVIDGKVTKELEYISPENDKNCIIVSDEKIDRHGNFLQKKVLARYGNSMVLVRPEDVTHFDVNALQWLSYGAMLIPFLQHDEPARVAMAVRMLKQSVPVLRPEAPLIGTGQENGVNATGAILKAEFPGRVVSVDAKNIIIKGTTFPKVKVYHLPSMLIEAKDTCLRWRPCVSKGDWIYKGDSIADSSASCKGELSLGKNVKVAYMTWNGYNYEDAVIISERLVADEAFTSLHVKEYVCKVMDTPFGAEEITSDIPDVSMRQLNMLDENGIAYIGSQVKENDILVGKVTPKDPSGVEMLPEEKLINSIRGYWGPPVKDKSKRVEPNEDGTVVGVDVLISPVLSEDEGPSDEQKRSLSEYEDELDTQLAHVSVVLKDNLSIMLRGEFTIGVQDSGDIIERFPKPRIVNKNLLDQYGPFGLYMKNDELNECIKKADLFLADMETEFDKKLIEFKKMAKPRTADKDVLKEVRVKIARRCRLQVGDKIVGRHGNKGIISVIVPVEDMPFDKETGEHVDIILSPLGIPSRMNVGQLLEVHMGFALEQCQKKIQSILNEIDDEDDPPDELIEILDAVYGKNIYDSTGIEIWNLAYEIAAKGQNIASPSFYGATEDDIYRLLEASGHKDGLKRTLVDGKTGQDFDFPVTVGTMYMMKLHHMVDKKVHARSTGPYSLFQQPMKGASNKGGQKLGEMEVWALQAHGAAYNLLEMLSIKSDNVKARYAAYEHIVKTGESPLINNILSSGINMGESNKQLFFELSALGLSVSLVAHDKKLDEKSTQQKENVNTPIDDWETDSDYVW